MAIKKAERDGPKGLGDEAKFSLRAKVMMTLAKVQPAATTTVGTDPVGMSYFLRFDMIKEATIDELANFDLIFSVAFREAIAMLLCKRELMFA